MKIETADAEGRPGPRETPAPDAAAPTGTPGSLGGLAIEPEGKPPDKRSAVVIPPSVL